MTSHHRLLLFAAAAAMATACVPTQRAVRGAGARGTEAWSWRMSATDGRWSKDRSQAAARSALEAGPAPEGGAAEPEAAAAGDEVEMTLEPDPVGPAKKPKALAVAPTRATPRARADRRARPAPIRGSDSDEEFLNKILDDNADAEDGEITMAAMALPKSKADRAAAKKKLAAPVTDPAVDLEADLEPVKPAKKKRMTRAEKRKARLLAKLEKKRAKEIAAREARLRGKRARVDEEEQTRASHARKAKRKARKGKFFKNGEGFLDEDEGAGEEDEEEEEDEVASSDEEEEEEDEAAAEEDEDDAPAPRKKAKQQVVASSKTSARPAARGKAVKVKTDWSGQAIDDEDPLKGKKK